MCILQHSQLNTTPILKLFEKIGLLAQFVVKIRIFNYFLSIKGTVLIKSSSIFSS